ncbi:esterase-like activity of phytase family protein [Labedaea rhizosphaerae]|uniref:Esterase-like activity of phytase family protein n=1 Tax=Labedaea rhizosphaerae TaxID=598644 RepID=A0A4R6RQX4_LABRH|nr:esterase-like activity of phytase family protein [Labedaea rhizosphaerae]TDP89201.1 hypothetical protein EV186_11425 [Labedaea rhizosphaerae]
MGRAWSLIAAVFAIFLLGVPASAAPSVQKKCTVDDERLTELSGLAADADHWYAINDGGSRIRVFVLGHDCKVEREIDNDIDPYDTEDLALAADGTFWLSDTGDNGAKRSTVALISVTPSGEAKIHRLTYPDGPHDTEALLLGHDGTPYLITKVPIGLSAIYQPTGKLASPGPTPLKQVGTLSYLPTGTPGGPVVNEVSNVLVTGGAVSADGHVVAVRTYTDVYLYPAPDGDVLKALKGTAVRVPLANEEQGEAIAFQPDGTLISGGEGDSSPIHVVAGAASLAAPKTSSTPAPQAARTGKSAAPAAGSSDLPLPVIIGVAAAALALMLLVLGLRSRRR